MIFKLNGTEKLLIIKLFSEIKIEVTSFLKLYLFFVFGNQIFKNAVKQSWVKVPKPLESIKLLVLNKNKVYFVISLCTGSPHYMR